VSRKPPEIAGFQRNLRSRFPPAADHFARSSRNQKAIPASVYAAAAARRLAIVRRGFFH
jgi:hypothetical protein